MSSLSSNIDINENKSHMQFILIKVITSTQNTLTQNKGQSNLIFKLIDLIMYTSIIYFHKKGAYW